MRVRLPSPFSHRLNLPPTVYSPGTNCNWIGMGCIWSLNLKPNFCFGSSASQSLSSTTTRPHDQSKCSWFQNILTYVFLVRIRHVRRPNPISILLDIWIVPLRLLASLCLISKRHLQTPMVHAKLDYSNYLVLDIVVTQINRLQAIQNALSRAVTKTSKHHHITPVLKKLHWLKIPERIEYNVISLTYRLTRFNPPNPHTYVSCSRSNHLVQPVPHPL